MNGNRMSRKMLTAGLLALPLLSLGACASSPETHYYMLAVVPGSGPAACRATAPAPLRLDTVSIPSELDRLALVRREGGNRLDIAGFERWGAPLDEQLRQTLSQDLAARLPPGRIVPPRSAGTETVRLVSVDVDGFYPDATGTVRLSAHWALLVDGKPVLQREERVKTQARGTATDATVAAMSRALGTLADRIAATLAAGGYC